MRKTYKTITVVLILALALWALSGCTEADRVNHNINKQADNFNVTRRLAVINARTDTPVFELVGNFSLSNNSTKELVITVETAPHQYKKHYVYLNDYTLYVVEDVSGSDVSPYQYEVNFLPQMFQTFTLTYAP